MLLKVFKLLDKRTKSKTLSLKTEYGSVLKIIFPPIPPLPHSLFEVFYIFMADTSFIGQCRSLQRYFLFKYIHFSFVQIFFCKGRPNKILDVFINYGKDITFGNWVHRSFIPSSLLFLQEIDNPYYTLSKVFKGCMLYIKGTLNDMVWTYYFTTGH